MGAPGGPTPIPVGGRPPCPAVATCACVLAAVDCRAASRCICLAAPGTAALFSQPAWRGRAPPSCDGPPHARSPNGRARPSSRAGLPGPSAGPFPGTAEASAPASSGGMGDFFGSLFGSSPAPAPAPKVGAWPPQCRAQNMPGKLHATGAALPAGVGRWYRAETRLRAPSAFRWRTCRRTRSSRRPSRRSSCCTATRGTPMARSGGTERQRRLSGDCRVVLGQGGAWAGRNRGLA
jgi:hypothetical protein